MSRRLPWSISTTVRNPARLRDFLRVLQRFEGRPFDNQTQQDYQIALIQERLYQPSQIPDEIKDKYRHYEQPLALEDAKQIFEKQNYVDPAMRGRQSVNPLNKLGLAIALQKEGNVRITPAGQLLLADETKASEIIFTALLKLQYPNPLNRDFNATRGFNIVPMIATMRLLEYLRSERDPGHQGLTREEFCLFIPTLLSARENDIKDQVERIVEFRSKSSQSRRDFIRKWLNEFYDRTVQEGDTDYNNLFDYGDNTMRYFRFTKYFSVAASTPLGSWVIDIEPTRQSEVKMLLHEMEGTARSFNSLKEYLEYLGDPTQPELPWKRESELHQIISYLQAEIQTITQEAQLDDYHSALTTSSLSISKLPELEQQVADLRKMLLDLSVEAGKRRIRRNPDAIDGFCSTLENILRNRRRNRIEPYDLEKLIFDLLIAFDDEEKIIPNYPMDDRGNPISHAPGHKADIECLYDQFGMIVEVTLDSSRLQWVREGQPVMRHLRDFERQFPNRSVFCLFLAPRIHQDTYSQFWIAVRYEYGGQPQRIVPLSFEQFAAVIQAASRRLREHQHFSHQLIRILLEDATTGVDNLQGYNEWREHIRNTVRKWCAEVEQ
ncbi:MAG: hypothetical protein KatS3mg019_0918 [Fimbriimonadales bacterium]|nr:MAG: hypothetical protein KatS3mg019_0918 [Fimbriimonadales bacterium]